jgi:exonuclease VII small subunit
MTLALFLDIVIAFLLVGTIYFVWQLSERLSRFRQNRAELERVIRDLNTAILQAQQSVTSLRQTADQSGEGLQKSIRTATELADELLLITEAGNNLAGRLERAADRGGTGPGEPAITIPTTRAHTTARHDEPADPFPSFMIRDPEFDSARMQDSPADSLAEPMLSQAERELRRALEQHQKSARS